ncbi:S8 family peptidase [Oceanobacillus damuensis]|uniref:S8 family peptidase n=1 Tax=Oceanobacillus damuensis TaxID=937928 RepID=UPI00082E322B|nr:S8 family peptidase [Oceanobacillus damuensis]
MNKTFLGAITAALVISFSPFASEASSGKGLNEPSKNPSVEKAAEKGSYAKGEVIVKFKDKLSKNSQQSIVSGVGAKSVEDEDIVESPFTVLEVGNVEAVVHALNKNPNVEYAEPNYEMRMASTPNDPYFSPYYQYGLFTTDTYLAWDLTRGDSEQEIAILDTGVDYNHEDLNDKTVIGYNFVNNDYHPIDRNGHGTHVAGIAAAETNNGMGIAGTAPETSILAVQVLDYSGSGTLDDVADGIIFAADNGAEVINLSLGCDCNSQTMEDAVDYAWDKGSVLVAASGNDGVSTTFEPASYENVIAVGAVDRNNNIAGFSNYGTWVDVMAPGVDIASTYIHYGYVYMSGTSMASPNVAGLAGLLAGQGRDNEEIRNAIEDTANYMSGIGSYVEHGLINSYDAVNY